MKNEEKEEETTKQCMFLQTEQIAAKNRQRLFFFYCGVEMKERWEERREEETETAEVKNPLVRIIIFHAHG